MSARHLSGGIYGVYWRAGASLPSRPNGAIFLYIYLFIYLYPALMYAVMFYVILNKRKLHFPLAKNVMHSPSIYYYVYVYTSLNAHAHARVSNARCQTGLNFGERSKFAVATFLSLAVCQLFTVADT